MMDKQQYLKWVMNNVDRVMLSRNDAKRPLYHFTPPIGWLNDPNGLFEKDGIYHIYYQYSPDDVNGGKKIWGHTTTKDFIHFEDHDPLLYADCKWDRDGVYSGSAFIEDGAVAFYYTGNVRHEGEHFDYIYSGREQNTICVKSADGFSVQEKQLILKNTDYPINMSNHVRDPKIIVINQAKYMILGARTIDDKGCALLYSEEKNNQWKYKLTLCTEHAFGYMWECPDIVVLQNHMLLITCPQGVKGESYLYQNAHQCGYFSLTLELDQEKYHLSDFKMLDFGFDFYAPQTFQDSAGRTILLAWLAVPDAPFSSKEEQSEWRHMLSIPRELTYRDGKIIQTPVIEMRALRSAEMKATVTNRYVYQNTTLCYECITKLRCCDEFSMQLRTNVMLTYKKGLLTLDMQGSNCGRKERSTEINAITQLQVFSDISSLEIFVNEGEYVFSTRVFDEQESDIILQLYNGEATFTYYELKKS